MGTLSRSRHGACSLPRLFLSLAFACATFAFAPAPEVDLVRGVSTAIERSTPLPPGPIESSLAVDKGADESKLLAVVSAGAVTIRRGNPGLHRHSDHSLRPIFSIVPSALLRAPPLA